MAEFKEAPSLEIINTVIFLFRQVLDKHPITHPHHSDSLRNLTKYPVGSHNYIFALDNLAKSLRTRFELGGQRGDLDEAISWCRRRLDFYPPAHPDINRLKSLHHLGNTLLTRFSQQLEGQRDDLDEAISLYREALKIAHHDQSTSLNNLASGLFTRFKQRRQQHDLDETILLYGQALDLCPPPWHPIRSTLLNNLAKALETRFDQQGQQLEGDLDNAILLCREALDLRPPPHPERPNSLNTLANALETRFNQQGRQGDLDNAVSLCMQALDLVPPTHVSRYSYLANLASKLVARFKQQGRQGDLDEGISLHRQALNLCPPPHPDRSSALASLARALRTQFLERGQKCDLDDAISLDREALELRPPSHPLHSASLNNLATTLSTRCRKEGQKCDLDEAIQLYRQALKLHPRSHPHRSAILGNLAFVLSYLFSQTGDQGDVDEVILLNREALELDPHPPQSGNLGNLANALFFRFKSQQGGHQCDLDDAISLHRQILDLRPPPHPGRSDALSDLAFTLSIKFEQGSQRDNLDEAISLNRQALELRPPLHPGRAISLHAQGKMLIHVHSEMENDLECLEQAMSSFAAATQCISQSAAGRLKRAKSWIHYADTLQHPSLIDAYDAALQTLPQLAALSLDVASRHGVLKAFSRGLAQDASICAIQAGKLDKAVEFLEAGRTIFWSQLLSLRSPFDELHNIAPELADRLRNIATTLELGSHRDMSVGTLNSLALARDQETSRLNRHHEEWSKSIEKIRQLKGFENFLQPRSLSLLQSAASEYPVASLVANGSGSHILIITSTTVHHIAVPSLPTSELCKLVQLIQAAASQSKIWRSSIENDSENTNPFSAATMETLQNWMDLKAERGVRKAGQILSDDIFRSVLKTLWNEVVKPVITFLKLEVSL